MRSRNLLASAAVVVVLASVLFFHPARESQGSIADDPQPKKSLVVEIDDLKKELGALKREVKELETTKPPVGAIVAWHRDINGKKPLHLPEGWLECDGQEIKDGLLKGRKTPNLNPSPEGYSGGRFLRGGTNSGILQDATSLFSRWEGGGPKSGSAVPGDDNQFAQNADGKQNFRAYFDNVQGVGTPEAATHPFLSVRPVNMSVIWVLRVR